jgi:enterochelin esterase family protein
MLLSLTMIGVLAVAPSGSRPAQGQQTAKNQDQDKEKAGARPRRVQAPPPTPPEVHPDRRVTFRLRAPNAKMVTVAGGFGAPASLEKNEQGVWSVTVGPLRPDLYGYSFTVDGLRMIDPSNPVVMPAPLLQTSVLEVPGDPPLVSEFLDVPHGTVRIHTYMSKSVGKKRNVFVYTPPGYDQDTSTRYPVFYLLHGSGDKEGTWTALGHAHLIADNLIAQAKARPMLIVMPDGHTVLPAPGATATAAADVPPTADARTETRRRNNALFQADMFDDIIPLIESTYRVRADRAHRAMAGLSMSGGQTLTIGLAHPEKFAWIGSFSASIMDPEPALNSILPGLQTPEGKLRLLWIGCGRADNLFEGAQRLSDLLKKNDIAHTFHQSDGGHSWFVWRRYLAELLPLLFAEKD